MIYAHDDVGEMIDAFPGCRAQCPMCGGEMLAKCGAIVTWHWAHASLKDCDPWAEGETQWHVTWKQKMPRAEVVIRRDGAMHRADAITSGGTVIEFQHSYISAENIAERERFYGQMVWVFDVRDAYRDERLWFARTKDGRRFYMAWNHPKKTLDMCQKPVFLDVGNCLLRMHRQFGYHRWGVTIGSHSDFERWANGEGIRQ